MTPNDIRITVKLEGYIEVRGLIAKASGNPGAWISYMGGQRYCGNADLIVPPNKTVQASKVICSAQFMGDQLRLMEILEVEPVTPPATAAKGGK